MTQAKTIEAMCQRYHVLPSVAMMEDASILKHMSIIGMLEH